MHIYINMYVYKDLVYNVYMFFLFLLFMTSLIREEKHTQNNQSTMILVELINRAEGV